MKKLIVMAAFAVAGLVNAQTGFKAGVHTGLPMGDAGDFYSFGYGLDVSYLFDVAEGFKAGGTAGYSILGAKEITTPSFSFGGVTVPGTTITPDDTKFITIGATAQYSFSESIFGGLDLGYAIPNEGDGALYYLPKVGYQTQQIEVYVGYRGIATEGTAITSVQLGFNYKF